MAGVEESCIPVTICSLSKQSNVCMHICASEIVLHTIHGDKTVAACVAYVKPFVCMAKIKDAVVQSEIATLGDEYADIFE